MTMTMTSSRPYLIRAMYQWLVDNHMTPYLLVDASHAHVRVPERFIEDNRIILNIAEDAVRDLKLENSTIEFLAQFSGVVHHIVVPVEAVQAIYASENGQGMAFPEEEGEGGEAEDGIGDVGLAPAVLISETPPDNEPPTTPSPPRDKKPSHLKIVK